MIWPLFKPAQPTQARTKGVAAWSRADLARMVRDDKFCPPPLLLKLAGEGLETHQIEVAVTVDAASMRRRVTKTYKRALHSGGDRELKFLQDLELLPAVSQRFVLPSGYDRQVVRASALSVMPAPQKVDAHPELRTKLTTDFAGITLDGWFTLLGVQAGTPKTQARSPFESQGRVLLRLVLELLKALQPFHAAGFVHCDLLPQNIVLPVKARGGLRFQFDFINLKLLDLEFGLRPLTQTAVGQDRVIAARQTDWFRKDDANQSILCLMPIAHSASTVAYGRVGGGDLLGNEVAGEFAVKPNASERLKAIDWGADLYCLGNWLMQLTHGPNGPRPFDDADDFAAGIRHLMELPARLMGFDCAYKPGQVARPASAMPHEKLIATLNTLLNDPDARFVSAYQFTLPSDAQLKARDAAQPTESEKTMFADGAGRARREKGGPVKRQSPLPTAALALGLLGGAAAWQAPKLGTAWEKLRPPVADVAPPPAPAPAPAPDSTPAPAPATPAPPTPEQLLAKQLADASAQANTHAYGSATWKTAFEAAANMANHAQQSASAKIEFWQSTQARYLQQTEGVVQSDWWQKLPDQSPALGAAQLDWVRASLTLDARGIWPATMWLGRAVVSERKGLDVSKKEFAQLPKRLLEGVATPNYGPAPALPPDQELALRTQTGQLLFFATYSAANKAKAQAQPVDFARGKALAHALGPLVKMGHTASAMQQAYAQQCLSQVAPPRAMVSTGPAQVLAQAVVADATAHVQDINFAQGWLGNLLNAELPPC